MKRLVPFLDWLRGDIDWLGHRVYRARLLVQLLFAALSLWAGFELAHFVDAAENAGASLVHAAHIERDSGTDLGLPSRPAAVEAYLPISGLMGLVDWLHQGTLNRVHPAATIFVLIALLTALLLRRGFCGWICPIGLLSELAALPTRWLRKRDIRLPRWLDIPLRAPKYLLLAFFLWAILSMPAAGLRAFIESPYNRVADVKMLEFFASPSRTTLITLAILLVASMLVRGAWCRYLCPYGALLGLVAWLSPTKVHRDERRCVGCGRCDRACWARLPVSTSHSIDSPECSGCLDCLASCPHRGALGIAAPIGHVRPPIFAACLIVLTFGIIAGAKFAGLWETEITDLQYIMLVLRLDGLSHP